MGTGAHVLGEIEGPYVAGKVVVPVSGDPIAHGRIGRSEVDGEAPHNI